MMTIRKATENDIRTIAKFQQKMAYETEQLELDEETLIRGVGNVLKDPSKGFYLLAQENGNVIASMLLTPEWSDWRNSLYLWIQSLYVLPEHRKTGVFSKLYGYVRDLVMHSDEYAGLKLYVDKDNSAAQEAYRRVGMKASHYNLFEWNKSDH